MEPRLRDALDMLFGPQRFSIQHAAGILRVEASSLTACVAVLEKAGLVECRKRGEPGEHWYSNVGDGSVAALVAWLEESEAGAEVLATPLASG